MQRTVDSSLMLSSSLLAAADLSRYVAIALIRSHFSRLDLCPVNIAKQTS
jgi:hypothetical protein